MDIVKEYFIKNFELYHSHLVEEVEEYNIDRLGYLVVRMKDGSVILFDNDTYSIVDYPSNIREMSSKQHKEDFGRRLRLVMRRKGFTQKRLSEESGISEVSISRYVNGGREPSFHTVDILAYTLGCSVDDLRYTDPRKTRE